MTYLTDRAKQGLASLSVQSTLMSLSEINTREIETMNVDMETAVAIQAEIAERASNPGTDMSVATMAELAHWALLGYDEAQVKETIDAAIEELRVTYAE